jgi:ribonuclease D
MSDYAVNDTRYSPPADGNLRGDLRTRGRWEWFEQSCERAIRSAEVTKERDPDQLWRITGQPRSQPRASPFCGRSGGGGMRRQRRWTDPPFTSCTMSSCRFRRPFERGETVELPHLRGGRRRRFFEAESRRWPFLKRNGQSSPAKRGHGPAARRSSVSATSRRAATLQLRACSSTRL